MPDPDGVEPVDVPAGPLGPRQLQPPQRPGLVHHRPALVYNNAETLRGHFQDSRSNLRPSISAKWSSLPAGS